jgi:hypothetical protein
MHHHGRDSEIELWSVRETSFPNSSPQKLKKKVSLTLPALVAILLPSRYEYLTDGLKRRDVPALRVPSHLIKGTTFISFYLSLTSLFLN